MRASAGHCVRSPAVVWHAGNIPRHHDTANTYSGQNTGYSQDSSWQSSGFSFDLVFRSPEYHFQQRVCQLLDTN
jgi:hypothetical protein